MKTKIDFINGNTRKCLFSMTMPLLAAMVLNMAYNLVDSLWIGNLLGESAYAALTNATPIILLLTSIAMGATNGVSILISHAVGEKADNKIKSLVSTSFVLSVVFSLFVTIIAELFLHKILLALNTPTEIYEMAYDYLSVYLIGYIAVYLYSYFTAVLRSFGDSVFQMIAMLICTVLNAVLDPIFINLYKLRGAAIATVLTQLICMIFMIIYLRKKELFKLSLKAFDFSYIKDFFAKGLPSAFQQSIPAISTSFLISLVTGYGITAIAAYGIAGRLETVLFYPSMALNMVLTVIVGQCTGGGHTERAKDYVKSAVIYGGIFVTLLSLIIIVFSGVISGFFVDSTSVAQIVARYFEITSIGYVLYMASSSYLGAVNGLGKPFISMICMVFYYMIIRMPLAWVLSHTGLGIEGIWWSVLISHVLAITVAVILWKQQLKKTLLLI